MENENKTNQNCGCTDPNCCTPKKSKLWMKIVFIVIVVAAATIVTIKLVSNNSKTNSTEATTKSSCCDSSKSKTCNPGKNPSCCSKEKK